jgi:hypothetical protein
MKPSSVIFGLVMVAGAAAFYIAYDISAPSQRERPAPIINGYRRNRAQKQPVQAQPVQDQDVQARPPQEQPVQADTPVYTPEFANAMFRDNEVSAEARFAGRTLIGGRAVGIETNFLSGVKIDLVGTSGQSVMCEFDEEHKSPLGALHNGSVVAVSCDRARRYLGTVIFGGCELVKVVE